MYNKLKIILIEITTTILFFVSFKLYYEDMIIYCLIVMLGLLILVFYLLDLLFSKKNKILKSILRKYDSILVHINDNFISNNCKMVRVNNFHNLVVAHERLGEPILYFYENDFINFLVNDENNVLLYKLAVYNIK